MIHNWFSFALWTALHLLFGFGDTRTLQHRQEDLPSTVFRGDTRTPEAIRASGGFYPRDPIVSLGRELTTVEIERSASLYYHHTGMTPQYTRYVSTTPEPDVACGFARRVRPVQAGIKESGYLYRISADPKMVDVVGSLGKENMVPGYAAAVEQAAVGGIPYEQIEGWYRVDDITSNKMTALKNGERLDGDIFQLNEQYNPKYTHLRGSGRQYQLAGFPNDKKGLQLRKTEPWKRYRTKKVNEYLDEFQERVATNLKGSKQNGAAVAEAEGEAAGGSEASTAADIFVEADPLGARDLIGALDAGELGEGLMSLDVMRLAAGATALGDQGGVTVEIAVEVTEERMAAMEAAEAVEAEEALAVTELAAGEAVSVLGEIAEILLAIAEL